MRFAPIGLGFVLMMAVVCGCGGSVPVAPDPTPAKGKVTYQGKPLTKGSLMLEPEIGGRDLTAEIRPDGTFELGTMRANDGAAPGPYRAYISGLNKSQIPLNFHNPSSSGTKVEIKADQTEYTVEFK